MSAKKKRSAKQLANDKKLGKMAKARGKKSKPKTKTKTKTKIITKIKTVVKRKTNKGGKKSPGVKRNLGLKSITGSSTIKKVALGIGGGVMATAIISAVMPQSQVGKFAAPLGAFALGGIEGVIGNFALSMLGNRTGSNTNVSPIMEAL